jgi:4-carboxymuconolactone decarboxylase
MTDDKEPSGAQKAFGDFAPAFVGYTDDVLFGQVWERPGLSLRDRSLITVASLLTCGSTEQLVFHLANAKRNSVTETELFEVITHVAFYAGWPKAMSAMAVAKKVFTSSE